MIYKISISKKTQKFLNTCDKHIQKSFYEKVDIIAQDPFSAKNKMDIKPIIWEENIFRLRIWNYRFIYSVIDHELVILFINADSRGGIYKNRK